MMEILEINTFVKLVQTGSFTRTAEILGTQKSNVSRVISNLEKKLQVRLLERNTRTLVITPIGQSIYEKCVLIMDTLTEAESLAKQEWGEPQGLLRLTCGVEFGMLFVSKWINHFMQTHPQVTVEANYTSKLVDLIHEGFDLAIRLGELDDSTLIAKRLGQLQYGLYAAPSYIEKHGIPRHPQELTNHNCIIFNAGLKNIWPFFVDKKVEEVQVNGSLKINNLFAVLSAAEQGFGVARLPIGLPERDEKKLVRILGEFDVPAIPVYAVFPSQRFLTPKVRAFIELAASECEQLVLT
ncbi:transcriptional regulator [Cellvibrio zantedeschiae]|uniref:Transcriptional regulator n=1 Tax=Cellvibrio zantedeschiae TaxID=1237077 RepID=A0ABQ3B5T0_9GAMM|nr:LysR family transcriptional regulator [Cellvibrio zantedeschiae]GGY79783.1 transcriptional regulator [Cellvibrio zantedeschiae]